MVRRHHADTAAEKVIRNRPTDLSDACSTSPTTKMNEIFGYQLADQCETLFPTFGDTPRPRAAGSRSRRSMPAEAAEVRRLPVSFTAAQQARLQATFPSGVCDWSKPGVDERPPLGTWLDYGP